MIGTVPSLTRTFFVLAALLLLSQMGVLSAPEQLSELTVLLPSFRVLFASTLVRVLALRAPKNRKMPLILSEEHFPGGILEFDLQLIAELLDSAFSSPLMSVLSQVTAL